MRPYDSKEFIKLIAIYQAMQKQRPKKPKQDKEYKYGRRCLSCNYYLGNIQFIRESQKYCENCGQKIDWREE